MDESTIIYHYCMRPGSVEQASVPGSVDGTRVPHRREGHQRATYARAQGRPQVVRWPLGRIYCQLHMVKRVLIPVLQRHERCVPRIGVL